MTQPLQAVFLDQSSLNPTDLDFGPLEAVANWQWFSQTSADQVASRIEQADIVACNKVILNKQQIVNAQRLKLIIVAATGVNNIDLDACREQGIAVYNCQSYGNESVVQHSFALLFALANQLTANHQAAIQKWPNASQFCLLDHLPMQLAGKTFGLVGYGSLGKKAAQVAEALGMKVIISARKGQATSDGRVSFEQLLKQADIISLHCPLTAETKDLFSLNEFKQMQAHALLINTARGGIVNETDLVQALQQGLIAGAASDVLTEEPPVNGNPLLEYRGANLIVTPHMAWSSSQARQTIIEQLAQNIENFRHQNDLRRIC
ncbi:D-2-hydroxyacid dehydrogenase [Reinekea thalattae]|uniref:D-2-hydroxyacid dehydrogenase n=1 Tax=Reinekea thalattae TaxID=2593301 RepID=A0A5C8ZAD7_9GAMM|nr:D-2-hydroxyacid dehydrogenase [Reinekea thalattae]TXR54131.1 D-2-hydroxyacid dehydrogenase [Reinekea thalattae]